jgi:hypothetical protein
LNLFKNIIMKKLLFIGLVILAHELQGQSNIIINITANDAAKVVFIKGSDTVTYKDIDISDGQAKITINNQTTTNQFRISFAEQGGKQFVIPPARIPRKQNEGDATAIATFNIDKNGTVQNVVGDRFAKSMNIVVQNPGGQKLAEVQGSATSSVSTQDPPPPKPTGTRRARQLKENRYLQHVLREIDKKGYRYVRSQNILVDRNGTIHIYLDENLNPIFSYFPTTAKENYDKFQFHIISPVKYKYVVSSDSELNPRPVEDDITGNIPAVHGNARGDKQDAYEYESPILGPYTTSFAFFIERFENTTQDLSLERTVKLLKVSRVSLDIAAVSTWLRNPQNVAIYVKPEGDSTLVADDPTVRGLLTAMLTFHFKPRNLNIPPRNPGERLGVSFGVGLSEKIGENFFLGLNFEVATGLFVNGGVHFGRVNYPINNKHFNYGEEKFSGTLTTKKGWDANGYVAISVDMGLFVKAFNSLFNTGQPGNN